MLNGSNSQINSNDFYDSIPSNKNESYYNYHNKVKDSSLIGINMEKHFICKECNTVPIIICKSYNIFKYTCLCSEIQEKTIETIFNKNIYEEARNNDNNNDSSQSGNNNESNSIQTKMIVEKQVNEESKEKNPHFLILKCKEHKEEFVYYCKECNLNICRKCLTQSGNHKDHQLDLFDTKTFEINKITENIKEIFEKKKKDSKEIINFIELMKIIFNDFKYYPNYSHFPIIKSCNDFLQKKIEKNPNSNIINVNQDYIFINNKRELDENFDTPQKIKKIIINESNPNIISCIKILELNNLTELNLKDNFIRSIEPLANNRMENLEILNLACNDIDDSNIKYFFEFDFPKLKDLNLFQNKLTNPELFKFKNDINKLPKLKIFFVGNNKFRFNKNNLNDNYNFYSVLEIGISKNCFNQESIKYIQCFTFSNLEIIYLSNNNLENFDFIKNLELPVIKEFWLNNNNFSLFEPLEKYKTLEKIEMKNNNIKDIYNIVEFINNFKNLKRFDLEGNKFDTDNILNKMSLDIIKKDIKIIINPTYI